MIACYPFTSELHQKQACFSKLLGPVGDVIYQVIFLWLWKIQTCIQFTGQQLTKVIKMNLRDVNLHFYTAISLQALNKVCRNKWFVPPFILNLQKTAFPLRLPVIVFNYECVCMDTGIWVQTPTETARGIGQSWAGVAEVVSHLTWVLGANSGPPSEQ